MRILLVEDDEVDQLAFRRAVKDQQLPYEYEVASSVAQARARLEGGEFDIILLDYNLGDGTALDILDLKPTAPVIVITGASQIDIAVSAMKAGAYDYLVKDLDRDYLKVLPLAVETAIKRKQAEETSRVLSHAVMSAADSVFITDLDGKVSFVNRAVTETYRYRPEEILGKPIDIIGEVGPEGEYYHRRADGSRFPASVSRSAVTDDGGREIAYVVLARDITESKRAEEELRRANEELEGYAHTVSHDLKGPLSTIILGASTLAVLLERSGALEVRPEIGETLEVMENSVLKSTHLIEDLLSLAEAGQTPSLVERVDVDAVVARVLEESAPIIAAKGVEVKVDTDLGALQASPTHVYQLFANLINNCVKHCESDHPVIVVARLVDGGGGRHRYLVRDNGKGIPEEDMQRIFAPFFKGPTGGTGIGLATVEKIVTQYGGEIRAYNEDGACFEFSIADFAAAGPASESRA